MKRAIFLVALASGLTLIALSSKAAKSEGWIAPGEETVRMTVGGFLPSFNTDLRVNLAGVASGGVNLEDDLGLSDQVTTGYGAIEWRLAPRHRLRLAYFRFARDASFTADGDIEIGDGEVIEAGATGTTRFDLDTIPFIYRYSFLKRPNQELAFSVGLHWGKADFSVAASAWKEDAGGRKKVSASADVPMPLLGLTYDYWVNDRWVMKASAGYFALDLNASDFDFQGSIYDFRLGTEYWIANHFGIGAAVDAFRLDVRLDQSDWKGSLDYAYWGPQLYLTARF